MTEKPKEYKFVELIIVQGDAEAHVIKSLLESSDIAVKLTSHIAHSVYPFTVNGLGIVKILVPEEDKEHAMLVLAEYRKENESG